MVIDASNIDNVAEKSGFSGVIHVSRRSEVLYSRASGWADRSNRIPNTTDTRFAIASGTKLLTALAIGSLVNSGGISLDDRLESALPGEFPEYDSRITIRHLLTHTSGIPDYYDEELVDDMENFRVAIPWSELATPSDYIPALPRTEMKFAPGERFSYCNSGFIILGIIIERTANRPYADYVCESVLGPAGMSSSGFFAFNRLPAKCAFGYIEDDRGWRTNIYDLPIVGASDGGAYTTAADTSTLWHAMYDGAVLPLAMIDEFLTPFVNVGTGGESYGHGMWFYRIGRGNDIPYFTGCDAGVSFKSWFYAGSGISATVISNSTNGAWPVGKEIQLQTDLLCDA